MPSLYWLQGIVVGCMAHELSPTAICGKHKTIIDDPWQLVHSSTWEVRKDRDIKLAMTRLLVWSNFMSSSMLYTTLKHCACFVGMIWDWMFLPPFRNSNRYTTVGCMLLVCLNKGAHGWEAIPTVLKTAMDHLHASLNSCKWRTLISSQQCWNYFIWSPTSHLPIWTCLTFF